MLSGTRSFDYSFLSHAITIPSLNTIPSADHPSWEITNTIVRGIYLNGFHCILYLEYPSLWVKSVDTFIVLVAM